MLSFLPHFPLPTSPLALFGLLLIAGVVGGELMRRVLRVPRIVGYVLIGMALGASGLGLLDEKLISDAWIFVDIALGLILYELGLRLDFSWLKRDRWLLATGVAESALSFGFMHYALTYFGVGALHAAVAAAIGVATSPAVVMLVAQELRAEGQVTERALNLTAINSVVAFVLVTMLLSWIHHEYRGGWMLPMLHPVYLFAGSLLLGYTTFLAALWLSQWLGKQAERQFVLVLALIIAAVGAARMLELSVLISLLAFGIFARNLDERHDLAAVDLSKVGQLFFVVLFVVTGARLQLYELMAGGALALSYILARFAGKSIAVMCLAHFSGVRPGTAGMLCLALTPMSGMAMAMVQGTAGLYPEFVTRLSTIVLSAVIILEIAGPIAVQFAFTRAGEGQCAVSVSLEFRGAEAFTVGTELELQILNSRDFDLARDAADLIGLIDKVDHPGAVKPEITESMVELNTGVHHTHDKLAAELKTLRDTVTQAARRLNVRIGGGGSHAFHQWTDRRIYPTERFNHLLSVYGYLAKQFTIFGQHVHIGCPDGDAAVYLTHILSRYVPHFIALSASSPFQQGEDTAFQSSRLNTVSAFPLSGTIPFVHSWGEFLQYFDGMRGYGIVESMKDFYWDIRPKPEYGTVETRVFDTPLTVERAALIACYVQALARHILVDRPLAPSREVYALYTYNRFQACRYGLQGKLVDGYTRRTVSLARDLLDTLKVVEPHAGALGNGEALAQLAAGVEAGYSDAEWLRRVYRERESLNDVARLQSDLWMGITPGK